MKNIQTLVLTFLFSLIIAVANPVSASPTNENKANNNPQVVAYYENSNHTVIQPDKTIKYNQQGTDLVLEAGEDKTFQQWYAGNDGANVHTVWRNVGSDTSCPESWLFVQNPYQPPTGDTWGYHFPNGDNYCVKSN